MSLECITCGHKRPSHVDLVGRCMIVGCSCEAFVEYGDTGMKLADVFCSPSCPNARLVAKLREEIERLRGACEYAAGSFAQVASDQTVPPIVLHDCKDHLTAALRGTL
jgi:hypothetical protein